MKPNWPYVAICFICSLFAAFGLLLAAVLVCEGHPWYALACVVLTINVQVIQCAVLKSNSVIN